LWRASGESAGVQGAAVELPTFLCLRQHSPYVGRHDVGSVGVRSTAVGGSRLDSGWGCIPKISTKHTTGPCADVDRLLRGLDRSRCITPSLSVQLSSPQPTHRCLYHNTPRYRPSRPAASFLCATITATFQQSRFTIDVHWLGVPNRGSATRSRQAHTAIA
jgi:hypothetical protein